MTSELEKANDALAGGRVDEASVFAWSALASIGPDDAPELARIARELGDLRLLSEIERRGFSTAPTGAPEPELVKRTRTARLLRALPAVAFALLLVGAIVANIPTESGERQPTKKDTSPATRFARPLSTERTGVWLVPLGLAESVDAHRLALELSLRYGVPVAVLPDVGLPVWTLDTNEGSLVAGQLILLLRQAYRAEGGAAIIGVTDFEMYETREDHTHIFSWRAPPHYGVVSTSSLGASLFDRLRGHSRHERTRKLLARNIGFLYYHRLEVDDPRSLLRPPMSGVGDIDKLRERL
jgi:hypothetical protein